MVCSCHQLAQNTSLALMVIITCNLHRSQTSCWVNQLHATSFTILHQFVRVHKRSLCVNWIHVVICIYSCIIIYSCRINFLKHIVYVHACHSGCMCHVFVCMCAHAYTCCVCEMSVLNIRTSTVQWINQCNLRNGCKKMYVLVLSQHFLLAKIL